MGDRIGVPRTTDAHGLLAVSATWQSLGTRHRLTLDRVDRVLQPRLAEARIAPLKQHERKSHEAQRLSAISCRVGRAIPLRRHAATLAIRVPIVKNGGPTVCSHTFYAAAVDRRAAPVRTGPKAASDAVYLHAVMENAMSKEDTDGDRLTAALVPPGAGASFIATRHGGLARIEPLTAAAEAWLRAHATDEASWDGDALVVEQRYFPDLVDAMIDAGHTFERDALPN